MRGRCHSLMEMFGISLTPCLFILRSSLMIFFSPSRKIWLIKGMGEERHMKDSTSTDVQVLQPPGSRIPVPEMPFWPCLKSCTLCLGCCVFFLWVGSTACEEPEQGRRDNKGWDQPGRNWTSSFPWPVKHLCACVSSPPLSLASQWPLSREMALCPRDQVLLWRQIEGMSILASQRNKSWTRIWVKVFSLQPKYIFKSLWQAHAPE